jgi:hypothetical protein
MPPVINHAFTQPVSAMRKNSLQALCRHFGLTDDGPVTTLRQRLKTHLQDNREQLENNPIYLRLYPRHGRGQQNIQPAVEPEEDLPNNDQDNETHHGSPAPSAPSIYSEWHGIHQPENDINDAGDIANPPLSSRQPSANPTIPPSIRSPEPEEAPFPQQRHQSPSFSTYASLITLQGIKAVISRHQRPPAFFLRYQYLSRNTFF